MKGEAGSLLAVKCDLNNESEILSMFGTIKSLYGGVDVCINNAGLAHAEPLLTGETDKWREMFNVSGFLSLFANETCQHRKYS